MQVHFPLILPTIAVPVLIYDAAVDDGVRFFYVLAADTDQAAGL